MLFNNLISEDMETLSTKDKTFNYKYTNQKKSSDNLAYIFDIVLKAKAGDENCMLLLIKKFEPLISKYSNSYTLKNYEVEDLMQIGNIAVMRAVNKYDSSRGVKFFDLYLINSIKNTYRKLARDNIKYKEESSLNLPNENSNEEIINLIVDDFSIEDNIINTIQHEALKIILSTLSTEEKELIKAAYLTPETNLFKYCKENKLNYPSKRRKLIKLLETIKTTLQKNIY